MHSVLIDPFGQPADSVEQVGPAASRPLTYNGLDGMVLLYDPLGTRPRIYYPATDSFDSRPLPYFNNFFDVGHDTSLLVFHDSILYFYPLLFDTSRVQRRTIQRPAWGTRVWPQGLVRRDPSKRIHLYFLGELFGTGTAECAIIHMQLDSLYAPIVIDTLLTIRDSLPDAAFHRIGSFYPTAGCDNHWQWHIIFGVHTGFPGGVPKVDYYVEFEPSGDIHQITAPVEVVCTAPQLPRPLRVASDTSSAIDIVLVDTVRLHAPLARISPSTPVAHLSPGITTIGSAVLCAWHVDDTLDGDMMTRWFTREDSTGQTFLYLPPPPERSAPVSAVDVSFQEYTDDRQYPVAGDMLALYEQHYNASFMYDPFGNRELRPGSTYNTRIAFARPGEGGWTTIDSIRRRPGLYGVGPWIRARLLGFNPDDRSFVVLLTDGSTQTIRGYPQTGSRWEIATPLGHLERTRYIPIGPEHYITADSGRAYHIIGRRVVDTFDIPIVANGSARYTALRGPRFLMSWIEADRLMLATFDATGTELARTTLGCIEIGCVDSTLDYSIAESPMDSSIAILVGGNRGVRMAHLSQRLDLIAPDVLISETDGRVAHPTGIFRGDTILVVWEDFREGAPRIYANALPRYERQQQGGTRVYDAPIPIAAITDQFALYPNPSSSEVMVTLDMTGIESATIDITNQLGELVMSTQTGAVAGRWFQARFDLADITSGIYLVRVRHKGGTIVRTMIKQ